MSGVTLHSFFVSSIFWSMIAVILILALSTGWLCFKGMKANKRKIAVLGMIIILLIILFFAFVWVVQNSLNGLPPPH